MAANPILLDGPVTVWVVGPRSSSGVQLGVDVNGDHRSVYRTLTAAEAWEVLLAMARALREVERRALLAAPEPAACEPSEDST